MVLTRLSLVIPFNLLNYAYGITSVRARVHLLLRLSVCCCPLRCTCILAPLARDIGQISSGQATPTTIGYWMAGAGLVAIVVLTWVMHRAASRFERHCQPWNLEDA